MKPLTLDDFEWEERGFDVYVLIHKVKDFPIAQITNFNGWKLQVWKESTRDGPLIENGLDLDAAKMVATLYASKHMEKYSEHFNRDMRNFYPKRKRASEFRPEAVPKGVFKVD